MLVRPEAWAKSYVGLPWVARGRTSFGPDCWGLVALVLRAEAGIRVDDWLVDPADAGGVAAAIEAGRAQSTWAHRVWSPADREDRLRRARAFDVVLMRPAARGHAPHVGIICGPGALLHTELESGSVIVPLTDLRILHRIDAIHRHEALV
jgi:cell wall-associated NlpC family hydrolase